MSLLTAVEDAIGACKAEQVKLNASIHLYRTILQSLTPETKNVLEDADFLDAAATDSDIPPGEKEEIELLEQALEKALWIRTGTGLSKRKPDRNGPTQPHNEPGGAVVRPKEGTQAKVASKGNQTTIRSTFKSTSIDKKEPQKPSSVLHSRTTTGHHPRQHKPGVNSKLMQKQPVSLAKVVPFQAAKKVHQTVSNAPEQGQLHTSGAQSKYEAIQSRQMNGGDVGNTSRPSPKNPLSASQAEETGAQSSPQQNEILSEQIAKWTSLRSKQNRLWDKALTLQMKPVPARNHFMERMRATFPKDWPCGSPDQTRALVNKLTHQGQDLTRSYQTMQVLAKQGLAGGNEQGGRENKSESHLTLENLEMMAVELQKHADQVKQEWEAWDRWRPEGGCLCPVEAHGQWGDGTMAPLISTVTYKTEAELRELEKLRMRVALLQQELCIQQALSDILSPQLSTVVEGPGCHSPSVLRDLYSLLGEGGEQFPALVLDTEPG
ncbi:uncharacterized protein tedc2 [Myripristis murdjan]|uniref:uncharacterized protein tedc2 n=1 Tax=Myripristis murdjan TaxID=586833 RepID=UPI001175E19F|nr:uncharacterized protein LOC115363006 [Myripristis murdjan]